MKIHFVVEPHDVWHYHKRVNLPRQIKRAAVALFIGITGLFLYDFFYCHLSVLWSAAYCLPVFGIVILFQCIIQKPALMKQARETPGLFGPITVEIGPDAARRKSAISESVTPWRSYVKITADDVLMYFFLTPNSAQIIPNRAFSDPREARRFLDAALSLWRGQSVLPVPTREETVWPPPPQTLKP